MMKFSKNLVLLIIIFLCAGTVFGATVTGIITDSATGDVLPGANVFIKGTNLGSASNLRGEFIINGIPPGMYKIVVSYIGYKSRTVDVKLQSDQTAELNISLIHQALKGEQIIITAQAAGQTAAINQQIRANSIKNIISAQRIQEIPEANAAESVGRLPGVSLKGSSLVIRGLSPYYNKIQIDGVDMASTSFTDRSSSLGMISQYMLEGIEMTKTALPDQDADVVGARVNLIIKEASQKPGFNLFFQNGFNTLSESFGNQKFVGGGSKRFFSDRLGVFGQMSFERSNDANNRMTAGYEKITHGIRITSMSLLDNINKMNGRLGATIILDYKTPLTKVKMSNFFSQSNNESIDRGESINNSGNVGHSSSFIKSKLTVITNSLRINHFFNGFELDGGMNYSFSKNKIPEDLSVGSTDKEGLDRSSVDWQGAPIDIPQYASFDPEDAFINSFKYETRQSESYKFSVDLNLKTHYSPTDWLGINLKIGGKFRHQGKKHDLEKRKADITGYFKAALSTLAQDMPWLDDDWTKLKGKYGSLSFKWVEDPDYLNNDFLLGDYKLGHMASENRIREIHEWMLESDELTYYKLWKDSYNSDYHGYEDYYAAYIMPEIIIGRFFTLIPGVRYEKNKTNYTGFRLPQVGAEDVWVDNSWFAEEDTTKIRKNDFILPMIHAIYRPLNWLDIRASYTHTLSRPSFADIIPSWDIGDQKVNWNNPILKPEMSKNTDLLFSFHSNKTGLFTFGGFYKTINNKIFTHGETMILTRDLEQKKFDGLWNETANLAGYMIDYEMNSPQSSHVYGYEVEWQSNFWFLPGILKGFVLNANYSRIYSDGKYPKVNRILDFSTFRYTYIDTFYTNRLIDQTDHIFNLMIGFDYKSFSIRGSMKYTDNLFAKNHEEPILREYTDVRIDYDVSIRQGLPLKGLVAFCNIQNLDRSKYVELNHGSGYPTMERYGGTSVSLGLRYLF